MRSRKAVPPAPRPACASLSRNSSGSSLDTAAWSGVPAAPPRTRPGKRSVIQNADPAACPMARTRGAG